MTRVGVALTAISFIMAASASTLAVPIIGGDPIYTHENSDFSGGQTDWAMTVYSYVYDETSASLPGTLTLDTGEMLFMYLLDTDETKTVSVSNFSISNPELVPINVVDYEDGVIPQGYDAADHQEPYIYVYSSPAVSTIYLYLGNPQDSYCTLDPGEYSLVYCIAEASGYGLINATVSGGGVSDNELIPGPVPEPATIFLLGLGTLVLLRKRKA